MTSMFLGLIAFVAITIGLGMVMLPNETSESFKRAGNKVGVPGGLFGGGVARFTGWVFVGAGVFFVVIAVVLMMR